MNFFPLVIILSYPLYAQLIYFVGCLMIAVFGINRTMGFWGYFFFSVIFSPILGLIIVLVSGKRKSLKQEF